MAARKDIMTVCVAQKIPTRIGMRPMTPGEFELWRHESRTSWSFDCPKCGDRHEVVRNDCFLEGDQPVQ